MASASMRAIHAISNGSLFYWGDPWDGDFSKPTKKDESFEWEGVATGYGHSLAIKNGEIFSSGRNSFGQLGLGDTDGRTIFTSVSFIE